MDEYQRRLNALQERLQINPKKEQIAELEAEQNQPGFWQDNERAKYASQKLAELNKIVREYDEVASIVADSPEGLGELIEEALFNLEKKALLAGPHDDHNAILSIHAGAGGTDAQDWTTMLLRMYQRFVERGKTDAESIVDRSNWNIELVDSAQGEEAGLKRVTTIIKGSYAYGLLKGEAGVHRLVRLSPFNAKNLRQTSFALVDVIPQIAQSDTIDIDDKDLRVDVYRSSGKGGQGVNTTDSAVRITHLPTNITVSIQNERSQMQNKAKAMEILKSRLLALKMEQNKAETDKVRGQIDKNEWGSQIRSYVLHPYKLVKDHRTNAESKNADEVLDGNITTFINEYLQNNN